MVFFIPWRVVAEESGAAHFGFGGAMLLDLPGPPGRAGGAVADFHFSDIPVRGDDGTRAIGANDDAAAVELLGRRRRQPGSKAALTGGRRGRARLYRANWVNSIDQAMVGNSRHEYAHCRLTPKPA
jgi:hypothetical protein